VASIPYKTRPRQKQLVALERSEGMDAFAYFMEMRTGKTKVTLDDAARAALDGKIDTLVVLAPNGVHRQWVEDQVPKHMAIPTTSAFYRAQGRVAHQRQFESVLREPTDDFRVLAFNVEAAASDRGKAAIRHAVAKYRTMLVIDESDTVKTPGAKRTKFLLGAARHAKMTRILTGTPITQSPLDLYAQYKFLDPSIIGFGTFAAFRSRYAVLMDPTDRRAQAIARKVMGTKTDAQLHAIYNRAVPMIHRERFRNRQELITAILQTCPQSVVPPMIAEDDNGRKIYRNLEELEAKIAPFTYRLKASECEDLPALVPIVLPVELTPEQRRIYNEMLEKAVALLEPPPTPTDDVLQWYLDNDRIEASNALGKLLRAQQVLGGHVPDTDGKMRFIKHNRIKALLDFLPQVQGKCIIWARFRPEIEEIVFAIREEYGRDSVVEFHGGIDDEKRTANKRRFQDPEGNAQFLVGQPAAGGVGHTFDAADTVIFYSNSFSARTRWQAEVRASAVGKESIAVVDLIAHGTIDEKIIRALEACRQQAEEFDYENKD